MIDPAYGIRSTEDLEVEPGTESYYDKDADFFITVAYEWCHDWPYEGDEHGYCHQRSVVVGLLREIERLRAGAST